MPFHEVADAVAHQRHEVIADRVVTTKSPTPASSAATTSRKAVSALGRIFGRVHLPSAGGRFPRGSVEVEDRHAKDAFENLPMDDTGIFVTRQDEFQRRKPQVPCRSQYSANHVRRAPGRCLKIVATIRRFPAAIRASSASFSRKGIRARFSDEQRGAKWCAHCATSSSYSTPNHCKSGSSVWRGGRRGNSSSTRATVALIRSARSSCSFHQPRRNRTGCLFLRRTGGMLHFDDLVFEQGFQPLAGAEEIAREPLAHLALGDEGQAEKILR